MIGVWTKSVADDMEFIFIKMTIVHYKSIGLIPWGKEGMFLIKLPRGAGNIHSEVAQRSGAFVIVQIGACLSSYDSRAKSINAAPKDGVFQNVVVS